MGSPLRPVAVLGFYLDRLQCLLVGAVGLGISQGGGEGIVLHDLLQAPTCNCPRFLAHEMEHFSSHSRVPVSLGGMRRLFC